MALEVPIHVCITAIDQTARRVRRRLSVPGGRAGISRPDVLVSRPRRRGAVLARTTTGCAVAVVLLAARVEDQRHGDQTDEPQRTADDQIKRGVGRGVLSKRREQADGGEREEPKGQAPGTTSISSSCSWRNALGYQASSRR